MDALLSDQTRPHEDLDVIVPKEDSAVLVEALRLRGFHDVMTDDRSDRNFVMGHPNHGLIDFHVVHMCGDAGAVYGPGEIDFRISLPEMGGVGAVSGMQARCMTAEYQVRSHSGYELGDTDIADMRALHLRLGVPLLAEQLRVIPRSR